MNEQLEKADVVDTVTYRLGAAMREAWPSEAEAS